MSVTNRLGRLIGTLVLCCGLAILGNRAARAEDVAQGNEAVKTKNKADKHETVNCRAFGARQETEPPSYVKPMSEHGKAHGISGLEDLDWLDFGLQHRIRLEFRDDYYYRDEPENGDEQLLMRSRLYMGFRGICDPLRFGFELEDSRQFMSDFAEDNRDVNEADILQLFGELYFANAFGEQSPLRLQVGRMSFDCVDRKLVARNRFRNTTNAYDGFRLRLGNVTNDWQVDAFAVMPVERRLRQMDRADEERWLYGVVGSWRRWSGVITVEPYYLILDEDRKDEKRVDREIHTMGLHAFGPVGDTRFDYDIDVALQFGRSGSEKHRAVAAYGEFGYSFQHSWKPRLSLSGTYGSGDGSPDDDISERFDRLFAANHFRSTSDLFNWQNTINPKVRLEFRPLEKLRVDCAYGAYWLASDADAWVVPGRRDSEGDSGDFVGQEVELRARYAFSSHAVLEAGYSHFIPGPFVENTGAADDSDFLYVAWTFVF